jgi:hypothetical protein
MTRIRATVTWDLAKLEKRVDQILENYGPLISFQLQEEISKDQFVYTNDEGDRVVTRRKNRQVVGSPRDIVDTGQLLNSQTNPDVGGGVLMIQWRAPYSLAVLRGGYTVESQRGNYTAKPRDWITPALREQPFKPYVLRQWRQLSGQ